MGQLAQDQEFMAEVWKEEVRVLEEKVPEVRDLC